MMTTIAVPAALCGPAGAGGAIRHCVFDVLDNGPLRMDEVRSYFGGLGSILLEDGQPFLDGLLQGLFF